METGTYECPICGWGEPHEHIAIEIERSGAHSEDERASMRWQALTAKLRALSKAEFDRNPRAFAERVLGTNTSESSMLVPWLLERIDRSDEAEARGEARGEERMRKRAAKICAEVVEDYRCLRTQTHWTAEEAERRIRALPIGENTKSPATPEETK